MSNINKEKSNVGYRSNVAVASNVVDVADVNKLQAVLGYRFNDLSLLKLALTHRSFSRHNNERLEFVGDGILDYVIAVNLYNRYPNLSEGELSKVRASMVNQDTLFEIAYKIGLGQYILLGDGEVRSGGRSRPSILADCLEAIFAAVSFDSSSIQAARVIENLYISYLTNVEEMVTKDFKSLLQEYLQRSRINLPTYSLVSTDGPDHDSVFNVECIIPELGIKSPAQGKSKKEASQLAAKNALEQIEFTKDASS